MMAIGSGLLEELSDGEDHALFDFGEAALSEGGGDLAVVGHGEQGEVFVVVEPVGDAEDAVLVVGRGEAAGGLLEGVVVPRGADLVEEFVASADERCPFHQQGGGSKAPPKRVWAWR